MRATSFASSIALAALTALTAALAIVGSAGTAAAQTPAPAAAPATAAPGAATPDVAAAPPAAVPSPAAAPSAAPTRDACMAALAADKAWENDLVLQLRARHATELNDMTRQRHDDDAKQIALNKRHVVLAYAALWLLSMVFLILQWRRQKSLDARITQLQKDLQAAAREGAK